MSSSLIQRLASARPMPNGTETVLVVEDDGIIRTLSTRILETLGYKVINASDGWVAYQLMKECPDQIHLIVSDVMMPELLGPEFVNRARELGKDFKVLYTSGYTRDTFNDAFDGFEGERDIRLLPKPYTPDQLAVHVRQVLDEGLAQAA